MFFIELGDPCCTWTEGSTPQFTEGLGHPGNKDIVPTNEAIAQETCGVVQPATAAPTELYTAAPTELATDAPTSVSPTPSAYSTEESSTAPVVSPSPCPGSTPAPAPAPKCVPKNY